jgi:hypothetical protein
MGVSPFGEPCAAFPDSPSDGERKFQASYKAVFNPKGDHPGEYGYDRALELLR